ncbi:MAG: hypothetical protein NT132_07925 [Microbacterium sp.]|uniref:hypothetical protein n=1 Tax=Microbacterium sp. TaxID=51671 RepID=UPI0026172784|nr:hypothetical protein [Microbacterium sp.]MCX6502314.1 hypothetical protein [Microbacterium sp.]
MADSPPDSIRFTPPRGRFIVLLVVCLLIGAMGVVIILLNVDNLMNLIIGAAAAGLFGVGGGISVIGQLRTPTLVADTRGLRVGRVGLAPWADVDRIGTTAQGRLGIRLRRTDALLAGGGRGTTADSLRQTRATQGGYDLVFTDRELGTPAKDAAAALRRFLP